MFIQTEKTPNPNTLKFLPGREVMAKGSADFADSEAAGRSPLATRLFAIDGVGRVFFGADFVTVGKTDATDWSVLKPQVLAAIMDHYTSGEALLTSEGAAETSGEQDSDVVAQIKELIDTRVRPAVANDGGDIIFRNFEDGVVYLHMQGACSGCPSSTATLKHGIENMLRYYVPEVQAVEAVD
ncbi:NifU family protein [Telmatospirillum sp.]|uniref:NifU family protein n=1 Tax=Telmatospirillum sp. TaxID=2079197 RepID=UPI0028492AFB|nr:NifU family protein [Telmatospirillum sp.]MDR3440410.1 NifU family protein [Telmatospirillum sp.]